MSRPTYKMRKRTRQVLNNTAKSYSKPNPIKISSIMIVQSSDNLIVDKTDHSLWMKVLPSDNAIQIYLDCVPVINACNIIKLVIRRNKYHRPCKCTDGFPILTLMPYDFHKYCTTPFLDTSISTTNPKSIYKYSGFAFLETGKIIDIPLIEY